MKTLVLSMTNSVVAMEQYEREQKRCNEFLDKNPDVKEIAETLMEIRNGLEQSRKEDIAHWLSDYDTSRDSWLRLVYAIFSIFETLTLPRNLESFSRNLLYCFNPYDDSYGYLRICRAVLESSSEEDDSVEERKKITIKQETIYFLTTDEDATNPMEMLNCALSKNIYSPTIKPFKYGYKQPKVLSLKIAKFLNIKKFAKMLKIMKNNKDFRTDGSLDELIFNRKLKDYANTSK